MKKTKIQNDLFKLQDLDYAKFTIKLTPSINPNSVIGVRLPKLRAYAKSLDSQTIDSFMNDLPHKYYEENLLHSILICTCKDYDFVIDNLYKFLVYVDNWAVCDTMRPKVFAKHKNELLKHIKVWIKQKHTYTIRFAIDMLMTYYLDDDFDLTYPKMVADVKSNDYYVNMMQAWYFATALAKKWDETIPYITDNKLSLWVYNKTIQKSVESFRITDKQKQYLKTLRK